MPTTSRKRLMAAFSIVILTGVLLGACSSDSSSSSSSSSKTTTTIKETASLPDFYGVPAKLSDTTPGAIIKVEDVNATNLDGTMKRVMYVSQALDGTPIAVTGLIAIPKGSAPQGGWPVVTWAHGTSGQADTCAPSLNPSELVGLANPLLKAGYLVVATDYEGLGTPGLHPYIAGVSEGRGTLDIVRAAQNLDLNASKNYVVWGHSQGGHAALFAGNIANSYAPELSLKGVVAGAPPSQLELFNDVLKNGPARHYILMAATGWNASYGDTKAPLDQVLTPEGIALAKRTGEMCSQQFSELVRNVDISTIQIVDPAKVPAWKTIITENDPGKFTTNFNAPLLIIHGSADSLIPPASSALLASQLCATKQSTVRWLVEGGDHGTVVAMAAPSMVTWINDRFAGKTTITGVAPANTTETPCAS